MWLVLIETGCPQQWSFRPCFREERTLDWGYSNVIISWPPFVLQWYCPQNSSPCVVITYFCLAPPVDHKLTCTVWHLKCVPGRMTMTQVWEMLRKLMQKGCESLKKKSRLSERMCQIVPGLVLQGSCRGAGILICSRDVYWAPASPCVFFWSLEGLGSGADKNKTKQTPQNVPEASTGYLLKFVRKHECRKSTQLFVNWVW